MTTIGLSALISSIFDGWYIRGILRLPEKRRIKALTAIFREIGPIGWEVWKTVGVKLGYNLQRRKLKRIEIDAPKEGEPVIEIPVTRLRPLKKPKAP